MQLSSIQTTQQFEKLGEEWNALLDKSASHVPFLRHEYLLNWWRTLGGGEWHHGELNIVTARHDDGTLAGIAPLFFTQNKEDEAALLLLGSIEISDYLDFLASPADLPEFVRQLFTYLARNELPPWKSLDLYNLIESSSTLPLLEAEAAQHGWLYSQERLEHCPYILLPGDWETYLAGIDKKQRHEIRRKMRRAETAEVPLRWYIVSDEQALETETEALFQLMAQDEEKLHFLTEAMRAQLRSLIQVTFHAGWLQLAFLEIDGEKAAVYLNFDYHDHIWVYNSGLDLSHSQYSPGWVLLGYLLQWANEHKRHAFDFMRGDEDYKYRFGGVNRFIVRAKITR